MTSPINQKLEILNKALEALPDGKKGSQKQNKAVEKAAKEALEELSKLNYRDLPDVDLDLKDKLQSAVNRYNRVSLNGGFKRWDGKGATQKSLINLFEKYQKLNNAKHATNEIAAYVEVKISDDASRITLNFHPEQQSTVAKVGEVVSTALTNIASFATGSNNSASAGRGPGGSKMNRLVARVWAKGFLGGTFYEYYNAQINSVSTEVQRLEDKITSLKGTADKTKLLGLIIDLEKASSSLSLLENNKQWRECDIQETTDSRSNISERIKTAREDCFNEILEVIKNHPENYKELCSESTYSKWRFFDKSFLVLVESISGRENLSLKVQNSINNFVMSLKILSRETSNLVQMNEPIGTCVESYLMERRLTGASQSENSYNDFKGQVKDLAKSRLYDLLDGAGGDLSEIESSLEKKLDEKLQSFIRSNPDLPKEEICDLIKSMVVEVIHDCMLIEMQQVKKEYLTLNKLLNKIPSSSGGETVLSVSEVELNNIISIVQILAFPDVKTEKEETVTSRLVKLDEAIITLDRITTINEFPQKLKDLVNDLKSGVSRYIEWLGEVQGRDKLLNNKIQNEIGRRHSEIVHRFVKVIAEKLRVKEENDFLKKLETRQIESYTPRDVFSMNMANEIDLKSPELIFWQKWALDRAKKLGISIDTTQRAPPQSSIEMIASLQRVSVTSLKEEFNLALKEAHTPFGRLNSLTRDAVTNEIIPYEDENLITELKKEPFQYTEEQIDLLLSALLEVREENTDRIGGIKQFLVDSFQLKEKLSGSSKEFREIPLDLQDWQIQQYLSEAGFEISPKELNSIISLNMTYEALSDASICSQTQSTYIYPEKKWRALRKTVGSTESKFNRQGIEILKLRESLPSSQDKLFAKNLQKEVKTRISTIAKLTGELRGQPEDKKHTDLNYELDRSIIHLFSEVNNLRVLFTDEEWDSFCKDVKFETLETRVGMCKHDNLEVKNHYIEAYNKLHAAKQESDGLLDRLSRGEKVEAREEKEVAQKYLRCTQVFNAQINLLGKYLGANPKEIAQPRKFRSQKELLEVGKDRVGALSSTRSQKGFDSSILNGSLIGFIKGIAEVTPLDLESEKSRFELEIKLAKKRGIFYQLDQVSSEIQHLPADALISEKQVLLEKKAILLAQALDARNFLTENKDVSYRDWSLDRIESEIPSTQTSLRGGVQDADFSRKVQQNIVLGIRQRALEAIQSRQGDTFNKIADEKESAFIELMMCRAASKSPEEQAQLTQIYLMRQNSEGWKVFPEYQHWRDWVANEYEESPLLAPLNRPSIERATMEEILTFLSEISGKDPSSYNEILFERFKAYSLVQRNPAASQEVLEKAKALSREIDSVFFGARWGSWVDARCSKYATQEQIATWKKGGIRYFSEIEKLRTNKREGQLEKEFIEGEILPIYRRFGIEMSNKGAGALMGALIEIQGTEVASEVASLQLPYADNPNLQSVICGDKWRKWVHDRCNSRSAPTSGAQEAIWAAGGIQYLDAVVAFRSDSPNVREDYIKKELTPALKEAGIDLNPTQIDALITRKGTELRNNNLKAIKAKANRFCNLQGDSEPPAVLRRAFLNYIKSLGISSFNEDDAEQLLLQMKATRKFGKQLQLASEYHEGDLKGKLDSLVTSDGGIDEGIALELGLTAAQIQSFKDCYKPKEWIDEKSQDMSHRGDWNTVGNNICQGQLKELDLTLAL